ncbi:MAG TPA: TorF family putative porin, partial [Sphingopyxis sp.]|nr:TorF family putative porin [Sphingopyxis sp.]
MTRFFAVPPLAAALIAMPAAAQEVPSGGFDLSGRVELVSDYRYRGISRTDVGIAVQPTLTIDHDSGLYLGAWGSNLDDGPAFGDVELNIYGGYETQVAPGTRLDVGLTYYLHPDGDRAFGPSDYGEASARLSYMLGPLEATGRVAYAWDQAALGGDDSLYLNLGLSAGLPATPVTLAASVGYTDGALAALAPRGHYFDWSLGARATFGSLTAGVRYVDTDIAKTRVRALDKLYRPTVVLSLGLV